MNKKRFINIIEKIVEKKVKEELPKQLKEIFIKEDFKDETVDLKSLSKEFIPNLSIIDLIFQEGENAAKILEISTN